MKISELIEKLEELKSKVGDVQVYSLDCGYEAKIKSVDIGYYDGECVILE